MSHDEVTRIIDKIINEYDRVDREIVERLSTAIEKRAGRSAYKRIAKQVEKALDNLDKTTSLFVADTMPELYSLGVISVNELQRGFEREIHRSALKQMQKQTQKELLSATRFTREAVKEVIRRETRISLYSKLTDGKTALGSAKELAWELRRQGLRSVIYKDGSARTLKDYSDMVIRTESAKLYNFGILNESKELGVQYFLISDGVDCGLTAHDDVTHADGKIVDWNTAMEYPLAHPRCRRSFGPLSEIQNQEQAIKAMEEDRLADGSRISRTKAQIAKERLNDKLRDEKNKRRIARINRREARKEQRLRNANKDK